MDAFNIINAAFGSYIIITLLIGILSLVLSIAMIVVYFKTARHIANIDFGLHEIYLLLYDRDINNPNNDNTNNDQSNNNTTT